MTLSKMSNYGVKIMKKGKDVTSSNVLDYVFWSKYPSLNIKDRGSVSLTTSIGEDDEPISAHLEVNHDFGYKPQFMAFTTSYASQYLNKEIFNTVDYVNLDFSVDYESIGANILEDVKAYVTEDKIVFDATIYAYIPFGGGWSGIEWTYNVDYMLFMEEAVQLPT